MTRFSVLLVLATACSGRGAKAPAVADVEPVTLGEALPTVVVAADPDARWAVMCQGDDSEEHEDARVFTASSPHTPIATMRGVIASGGTRVLGVIDDQLLLLDTATGADRRLGPAWRDGYTVSAAFVGDHLLVGLDRDLVLHDLATEQERTFAVPDGRIEAIAPLGDKFLITVAVDGDGDGAVDAAPADARTCSSDGLIAPGHRSYRLCWYGDVARACPITDPRLGAVLDPATGKLELGSLDRFPTARGTLAFTPDGFLLGGEGMWGECTEILAVMDAPFRILGRCYEGKLTVLDETSAEENGSLGIELESEASTQPGPPGVTRAVRTTKRLWCTDEGTCYDLVEGVAMPDVAPPIWTGDAYALADLDDELYAIDIEHDGRWIIDGTREEPSAPDEEIPVGVGDMVAYREQVIDLRHHRVLSEGPWEIHALRADGTALVTTDEGDGPLRVVPPGTFEK